MCGIFGWSVQQDYAPQNDVLKNATDLLRHRGPDAEGHWVGNDLKGFQVALGHRRLSIIDLEAGAQPMHTHDGRFVIAYNGEVYNFVELRDELAREGHVFKTQSDTEVVLESYRAWGTEAFKRFRGMFAFAIFDKARCELVLARDHFGKKPLFVATTAAGTAFASEINPLLEFPGVSRDVNPAAVMSFLQQRYAFGPDTFFNSISKLPPGCAAVITSGVVKVTRYYVPPIASAASDKVSFGAAVDALKSEFATAVRLRMRSDVPVGAFLSGGIDSSAVVAEMSHYNRVKTYSVGFPEQSFSELEYAREVAQLFSTDHHECVITEEDFIATWPEAVVHRGAPISEPADIPIYLLSREASKSIKVVMTGEGADELLGGYPKHRAEYLIGSLVPLLPHAARKYLLRTAANCLPYGMHRAKTFLEAAAEPNQSARLLRWFGSMSGIEREQLFASGTEWRPSDDFPFGAAQTSSTRAALFFDQTSWLPDNLLERADRMMMASSIEGRMPFMDTGLADTVARMPDRFLVGTSRGKRVLRAALDGVLPESILQRKKVGFRVPVHVWFRGKLRPMLEEHLLSADSLTRRFCSPEALDTLVSEHLNSRHNHEKKLWGLLNLEIFLRTFKPELGPLLEGIPK